jgi:hypothetical protein
MFGNGYCETCIHWEQVNDNTGICQNTTQVKTLDINVLDGISFDNQPDFFEVIAAGIIVTHYDFGCISYRTKSEKTECHHFLDKLKPR